jgi:hypothetical protein
MTLTWEENAVLTGRELRACCHNSARVNKMKKCQPVRNTCMPNLIIMSQTSHTINRKQRAHSVDLLFAHDLLNSYKDISYTI